LDVLMDVGLGALGWMFGWMLGWMDVWMIVGEFGWVLGRWDECLDLLHNLMQISEN
jgi:hypothetical protein